MNYDMPVKDRLDLMLIGLYCLEIELRDSNVIYKRNC